MELTVRRQREVLCILGIGSEGGSGVGILSAPYMLSITGLVVLRT